MKIIAAISADLSRSPLGTRSRLGDELLGKPILRRTLERILRAKRLSAVHILTPISQSAAVAKLLEGLPVRLETHDAPPAPGAELVRLGRLWGLDGWRGGIGGYCCFDEDIHVGLLEALAVRAGADAVMTIPAAAALVAPAILDGMIENYEAHTETARITITQAPPGLSAVVLSRTLLEELAPSGHPPGVLLRYHPDRPIADITGKEACYRPTAEVIEAGGRLICDTRRSTERVRELIEAGAENWLAARIGRWLSDRSSRHVDAVPEEIEIELTTQDPYGGCSILRPGAGEAGRRGPIDLAVVKSVAAAISGYDDVRLVLGGFGEPCLHPRFGEICRLLRESSAAAIAVRTTGLFENDNIDPAAETALLETPVDVIEVALDAVSPETYRVVHGVDGYDRVAARLEGWLGRRSAQGSVRPLIVPSFVKADENLHELEAFFDSWQRRLGAALITGYSHCAGQMSGRTVAPMAPPRRTACRRTFARAMILADGRVTTCDQDFAGRQVLGSLHDAPLPELWQSSRLAAIRSNRIEDQPLCPACDEWHRP